MNKSLATNVCCAAMIALGYLLSEPLSKPVLGMGFFGLSGALTNWLAIHMLFERVPGLYGSGIIPLKFEVFKAAIRDMIMDQFFTVENIQRFIQEGGAKPDLQPVIENLDYDQIFEGFLEVIEKSKFGGMIGMFGGTKALESMREPFSRTLSAKLTEMVADPEFLQNFSRNSSGELHDMWQAKIGEMVDSRLAELTPEMVKKIIQDMIRDHLGWLVIWGGVFGSLIGFITSFLA